MRLLASCCSLLFCLAAAAADAPSITVSGAGAQPLVVDRAALAAMPRTSVEASDHGTKAKWDGVAMSELLTRAGAPLGDTLRGKQLARYVLVSAADGYRVVYALAEFDAAFGNAGAILADTRDGKPLDAQEGPFRIVMPDEQRAGRWIRQVTAIEVVDGAAR